MYRIPAPVVFTGAVSALVTAGVLAHHSPEFKTTTTNACLAILLLIVAAHILRVFVHAVIALWFDPDTTQPPPPTANKAPEIAAERVEAATGAQHTGNLR